MKRRCEDCHHSFWLPEYQPRHNSPLAGTEPTCPRCRAPAPTATNAYVSLVTAAGAGVIGLLAFVIIELALIATPDSDTSLILPLVAFAGVLIFLFIALLEVLRARGR